MATKAERDTQFDTVFRERPVDPNTGQVPDEDKLGMDDKASNSEGNPEKGMRSTMKEFNADVLNKEDETGSDSDNHFILDGDNITITRDPTNKTITITGQAGGSALPTALRALVNLITAANNGKLVSIDNDNSTFEAVDAPSNIPQSLTALNALFIAANEGKLFTADNNGAPEVVDLDDLIEALTSVSPTGQWNFSDGMLFAGSVNVSQAINDNTSDIDAVEIRVTNLENADVDLPPALQEWNSELTPTTFTTSHVARYGGFDRVAQMNLNYTGTGRNQVFSSASLEANGDNTGLSVSAHHELVGVGEEFTGLIIGVLLNNFGQEDPANPYGPVEFNSSNPATRYAKILDVAAVSNPSSLDIDDIFVLNRNREWGMMRPTGTGVQQPIPSDSTITVFNAVEGSPGHGVNLHAQVGHAGGDILLAESVLSTQDENIITWVPWFYRSAQSHNDHLGWHQGNDIAWSDNRINFRNIFNVNRLYPHEPMCKALYVLFHHNGYVRHAALPQVVSGHEAEAFLGLKRIIAMVNSRLKHNADLEQNGKLILTQGASSLVDADDNPINVKGDQGPQGISIRAVYYTGTHGANAPAAPSSTNGYNISTNQFVNLTNTWSDDPPTTIDTAANDYYFSRVVLDPSKAVNNIIPGNELTFSTPHKDDGETGPPGPPGAKGDPGAASTVAGPAAPIYRFAYRADDKDTAPTAPATGTLSNTGEFSNLPAGWSGEVPSKTSSQAIWAQLFTRSPAGATTKIGSVRQWSGDDGEKGDQGVQGLFYIRLYLDVADDASAPATPTATGYRLDTNSLVGVSGSWSGTAPSSITTNRKYYYADAFINPASAVLNIVGNITFGAPVQYALPGIEDAEFRALTLNRILTFTQSTAIQSADQGEFIDTTQDEPGWRGNGIYMLVFHDLNSDGTIKPSTRTTNTVRGNFIRDGLKVKTAGSDPVGEAGAPNDDFIFEGPNESQRYLAKTAASNGDLLVSAGTSLEPFRMDIYQLIGFGGITEFQDYADGQDYDRNEIVVEGTAIYRAKRAVTNASANPSTDTTNWEQLGGSDFVSNDPSATYVSLEDQSSDINMAASHVGESLFITVASGTASIKYKFNDTHGVKGNKIKIYNGGTAGDIILEDTVPLEVRTLKPGDSAILRKADLADTVYWEVDSSDLAPGASGGTAFSATDPEITTGFSDSQDDLPYWNNGVRNRVSLPNLRIEMNKPFNNLWEYESDNTVTIPADAPNNKVWGINRRGGTHVVNLQRVAELGRGARQKIVKLNGSQTPTLIRPHLITGSTNREIIGGFASGGSGLDVPLGGQNSFLELFSDGGTNWIVIDFLFNPIRQDIALSASRNMASGEVGSWLNITPASTGLTFTLPSSLGWVGMPVWIYNASGGNALTISGGVSFELAAGSVQQFMKVGNNSSNNQVSINSDWRPV